MIEQIFNELKLEARLGEIKLKNSEETRILRIAFNVVDDDISSNIPNLYIKNHDNFYKLLNTYVNNALKFYELEENYYNIKLVLSYLFVNITMSEMTDLENYVSKYINFINDINLKDKSGEKTTTLGNLKYSIEKQSIQQETPYSFKSYFEKDESKYALPRISFGICNGVCYIYAIQNKDSKINIDFEYNKEVKEKLRTINSGISKYRNVTPSFVVALSLFISFLKDNNINKIKIVTPLPIRQMNRELSLEYKIKFYSMYGKLSSDELEKFKKEITDKKLNDDYNSTIKFFNCFNRLRLHFDNLFLHGDLNKNTTIEIINLITNNDFLGEVVKEKER